MPALDIVAALWLGILTSISPCPLATNIAAISYVGRRVGNPRAVLAAGLLYTLGRALVYVAVALIVTRGLLAVPGLSMFLQRYMNLVIGPLLIVLGVVLLGIIRLPLGGGVSGALQARVDRMGIWGAALLGVVFALAFCPTSAGLFFGGLIPLSLKGGDPLLLPGLYALGTALPVIAFALLLAFGAHMVGVAFKRLTAIELWVRRATAVVLLAVGLILTLKHNAGIYLGF